MAFSSISFLFYFLPLFFAVYWLVPARWKNAILAAGSLFFYAWGDLRSVPLHWQGEFMRFTSQEVVRHEN